MQVVLYGFPVRVSFLGLLSLPVMPGLCKPFVCGFEVCWGLVCLVHTGHTCMDIMCILEKSVCFVCVCVFCEGHYLPVLLPLMHKPGTCEVGLPGTDLTRG